MKIRKAEPEDLNAILPIYAYARERMRLSGNPSQWGEDYPPLEMVQNDIANGHSYLVTEADEIVGVFVFMIGEDPTYQRIDNGAWLNDDVYGTIHRVAGNKNARGIMRMCLSFCEAKVANIRIDTHECNRIMQHVLERSGYKRCGQIYTADGSPRIAYQKVSTAVSSNP